MGFQNRFTKGQTRVMGGPRKQAELKAQKSEL